MSDLYFATDLFSQFDRLQQQMHVRIRILDERRHGPKEPLDGILIDRAAKRDVGARRTWRRLEPL